MRTKYTAIIAIFAFAINNRHVAACAYLSQPTHSLSITQMALVQAPLFELISLYPLIWR